jgi:hypothetical protein
LSFVAPLWGKKVATTNPNGQWLTQNKLRRKIKDRHMSDPLIVGPKHGIVNSIAQPQILAPCTQMPGWQLVYVHDDI